MDSQPAPVHISPDDLDTIAILGESVVRNAAIGQNLDGSAYGHSSLRGNDVGLLGEHAMAYYLAECGAKVIRIADDLDARRNGWGDITAYVGAYGYNIEVKTQQEHDWKGIGRAVNVKQLKRLSASALVWCVVDDQWPTKSIRLMGWLPVTEARAHGGHSLTINARDYVRVTLSMRSMGELVPWLELLNTNPFDSM